MYGGPPPSAILSILHQRYYSMCKALLCYIPMRFCYTDTRYHYICTRHYYIHICKRLTPSNIKRWYYSWLTDKEIQAPRGWVSHLFKGTQLTVSVSSRIPTLTHPSIHTSQGCGIAWDLCQGEWKPLPGCGAWLSTHSPSSPPET